jgi:phospholipase C
MVYARGRGASCRHYAVEPGETIEDTWNLSDVEGGRYQLCVYGPNGYLREFIGASAEPSVSVAMLPPRAGAQANEVTVEIRGGNDLRGPLALVVRDHAYGNAEQRLQLAAGATLTTRVPVKASHGWYDFSLVAPDVAPFERRFAGRVETGVDAFSDPVLSGPG